MLRDMLFPNRGSLTHLATKERKTFHCLLRFAIRVCCCCVGSAAVCQNGSFLKDLGLLKDLFGQKGLFLVFFLSEVSFFFKRVFV